LASQLDADGEVDASAIPCCPTDGRLTPRASPSGRHAHPKIDEEEDDGSRNAALSPSVDHEGDGGSSNLEFVFYESHV
jgi:hypothetical protein